jgi:hypothetical protein
MITCTLIDHHGKKRVAHLDIRVPPYSLMACGKLFNVQPTWQTVDDRLATTEVTYCQTTVLDVTNDLIKPTEPQEVAA